MDAGVRHAVEEVLSALLRDYDAGVPETGAFPPYRRDVPLPAPYAPRRLVLVVHPLDSGESSPGRHQRGVDRRVESPDGGYSSQEWYMGTKAELWEQLRGPQAVAEVERFLDRVLPDDEVLEAGKPLDVPLVAVDRNGVPYAVLDPRRTGGEARGPRVSHSAEWHLLLLRGGEWLDAGCVHSQWEEGRGYLRVRVLRTVETFEGLAFEEFGFRRWEGPVPQLGREAPADEVDRSDPVAARLREICDVVIGETPNAQQDLGVSGAFAEGVEHVLEVRDGFDWSYYYVPVPPGESSEALAAEVGSRSMQEVTRIVPRGPAPRRLDVAALLEERRRTRDAWASPPTSPPPPPQGFVSRLLRGLSTVFRGR